MSEGIAERADDPIGLAEATVLRIETIKRRLPALMIRYLLVLTFWILGLKHVRCGLYESGHPYPVSL